MLVFRLTEEQTKNYKIVKQKFEEHFRVNIVLERARFIKRCQRPEKSIEEFLADLFCIDY